MISCLLPLALAWSPARAEEPAPSPEPTLLSETLPNGLHVTVLSDPSLPVVATQMWVQVGAAHETDSEAGFAHLFEHLMFGKTTNNDKEAYSRHHTMNGGSENAYTAFDNTVYVSTIGPAWHDQVLVFEADRMRNLVLDAENLENEKKIVTEELRLRTENDPVSRLLDPAFHAIFGDHPYGHLPAGTKEDLAAADLALVQKFYNGYYHPANMHLVIAGPVDGPATMARVQELFGPLGGERLVPPTIPDLASHDFPSRVLLQEDIPPIKVAALMYIGPTMRDPDYWAFKVMTEMLAGGELDAFREELVTERGKAIEAMTIAETLRSGSVLAFASINLPFRGERRAFKLLHQTRDTLTDEAAWMTQAKLDTAKRRLLRQSLERRYYAESQADALGQAYAWQGDETLAMGGAVEAIDLVTLEQVQAAWVKYVVQAEPVEIFVKKGEPKAEEVQ